MPTFGYAFKPWRSPKAIAGAQGILDYLRETASENGIDRKMLPADTAHELIRRKNVAGQRFLFNACKRYPRAARRFIGYVTAKQLPEDFAVDEHFNPPYDPWDQRLCIVPDGDLFKTIRKGQASVVTDQIEHFTENGVLLKSGRELEADIVVTATGLNIQLFGGVQLEVDGKPVKLNEKLAYKGMMLSDVPNFAFAIGYTNASWTLKVGLLCEHLCRLLDHMDKHGHSVCRPRPVDPNMPTRPLLDFGAGYVQRALSTLPRQGEAAPWVMSMDYYLDVKLLRHADVADENLEFSSPARTQSVDYASATAAE